MVQFRKMIVPFFPTVIVEKAKVLCTICLVMQILRNGADRVSIMPMLSVGTEHLVLV